jgi:hypothetical protein
MSVPARRESAQDKMEARYHAALKEALDLVAKLQVRVFDDWRTPWKVNEVTPQRLEALTIVVEHLRAAMEMEVPR